MSQGEMSQPRGEVLEDGNKPNVELTRGIGEGATTGSNGQSTITTPPHAQPMQQPLPQPYPQHQQQLLPYAPYQPQPYPSYAQPVRILPPYNQTWIISKLVLTGLSLLWAVIILALALPFALGRGYEYGTGPFIALFSAPVQIVVIVWNLAELITFLVRSLRGKRANNTNPGSAQAARRGIHPGAHIAMHLLFWLACIWGIIMSLLIDTSISSDMEYCYDESDNDSSSSSNTESSSSSSSSSSYCDDYVGTLSSYTSSVRAILAMWCLAIITHFVLFVLACIDTNQRNRLKPSGIVFAAPGPGGASYMAQLMPPPPQGMFPVAYYPQQQQQQQQAYMNPAQPASAAQEKQQVPHPQQQNYQQNLTGFYAPPPPVVSAQAPAPAHQAPSQQAPAPVSTSQQPASDGNDEITSAPART